MVVDAHVNITDDGTWFKTKHDASVPRLLDEMEEACVERALLVSMPLASKNHHVAGIVQKYPGRFQAVGHLDFSRSDLLAQIDEMIAMGFCGVKVHPRFQKVDLCDPLLDSVWRRLDELRCVLMVDGYCQTDATGILIQQLLPLHYESHVRRFPNVIFIFAHAGFHRVLDTMQMCRSYPNFYCDISFSLIAAEGASFYNDYRYLVLKADKKVLFGSDFPEFRIPDALQCCKVLLAGIANEKAKRVLGENSDNLLWHGAKA
jgi:predicted TIM-barrel fold metal-dependent hydrolase